MDYGNRHDRDDLSPGEDRAAPQAGLASHGWQWLLLAGLVALVFGIVVLANLFTGLRILAFFIGIGLLYVGVVELIGAFGNREGARWLGLVGGAIALVGGVIALVWPGLALTTLAVIAGVTFLVWGAGHIAVALAARPPHWGWSVAVGVAWAVTGLIALVWPQATLLVLAVLMGLNAVVYGAVLIASALALRSEQRRWSARGPRGLAGA